MTISANKRRQLSAFLGSLSDATALKLFAALDIDRLSGGRDLPHDDLLSDLRTRMLERGAPLPPRIKDARRIFFTPFEDFFIGEHGEKKRSLRISRSSLAPIWDLVLSDPRLADAAQIAKEIDAKAVKYEDNAKLLPKFFYAARKGLSSLLAEVDVNADVRRSLIQRLGSDQAVQDLREIENISHSIEFINQLHDLAPSNAPSLSEDHIYKLRSLFLDAHSQSPEAGLVVLAALKGRLERPWRALAVYYNLARSADDQLRKAQETVSLLPQHLFEDIETLARVLVYDGGGEFDADSARAKITYLCDYADGLAKEAGKVGDNVFLNRIEACREVAAEAHERFVEQAMTALRKAMPVRQAGGSSRLMSVRPDFSAPLNPTDVTAAHDAARYIASAREIIRRLGADPDYCETIANEAREKTEIYAKDLVTEIRAAEGASRRSAKIALESVLNFSAPILKSDVVGLIRDRAAAAAVSV
ncbi:MAG: hypothetical protein HKP25_04390 [Marinicaulis sp.]|nr:hypothetical protein [Marinicaulis sp.]